MTERTLAIIKPDAVKKGYTAKITDIIKNHGFKIVRTSNMQLTQQQAEKFYEVHKARSFFGELVDFMTSGPVVVMALEKPNAVAEWRKLMGDTNPAKAEAGTIRKQFGANIGENATHGSDATQTAEQELKFFFPDLK
jgi:nucleoside-diphosphate kinase